MGEGRGAGSEPGRLTGKVALITGAASGQGRSVAQLFAEHGAAIVVVDVNDDGAQDTVARIEKDGGRAAAIHADVARRSDCDAMVAAAVDVYGRLDVLYNNVAAHMPCRLVDTTEEMWDVTIATNLSSVFWACRAAIPHILAAGGGAIVSRSTALAPPGSSGHSASRAAKAGLIALTRQIALEYAPRVRANVIAPDSVNTADDPATVALFLATDASANTTGAVVPCAPGRSELR